MKNTFVIPLFIFIGLSCYSNGFANSASYSRANHDPKNLKMVKAFFKDGSISNGPVGSIKSRFSLQSDVVPCRVKDASGCKFIEPVGVKLIDDQRIQLGIRYVEHGTYLSPAPKYLTLIIYDLSRKISANNSKFKEIFMGRVTGFERLVSFVKLIFYRLWYFNRSLPDSFVTDILPGRFFDNLTSFVDLPREFKISKKNPPIQAWKGFKDD